MKVTAIIQARMGSMRFPNKVMQLITGVPMIELLIGRLSLTKAVDHIVVATTNDPRNERLISHVRAMGVSVFIGSEDDVLDRYYQAAKEHSADIVVRITGDCPLVDPAIVTLVVRPVLEGDADYCSNVAPPTFPDGLDVEAFTFDALERAWRECKEPLSREHVTPYLRESGNFRAVNVTTAMDHSDARWTVDEPADLAVIRCVYEHFSPSRNFSWEEVVKLASTTPSIFLANRHLSRNKGATMGKGQKLWSRAKQVIPGGNMLLSKRAEMFLPEGWPAYFSKSKGCNVWDLDGREYIDMSFMGIGTNTLGYGHPEIDDAVRRTIDAGNMATLNCPEEVYLAEKLVQMHPWADMVRLARSGGEANAIAIRIARAASGREKVAICGYHGWHDWYLAANLGDEKNLAGHLLPGLEPAGVPSSLKGTVLPFNYNRIEELQAIVQENDVGVIMMEVSRNHGPADGFLQAVRAMATQHGIVLIFDECTSGFRQSFGGLHQLFRVEPDMALFGKALGNGYAITAVIGRREIMQSAQVSFISSTFWTERIGPTAALKTLDVMERQKSWEKITATGARVSQGWKTLAEKYALDIQTSGLPALSTFSFSSANALPYKTLLTQEMLSKGYLATTAFYACTEHTDKMVNDYLDNLDPVFRMIRECEDGRDVMSLLKGPVCHAGFRRLN